MHISARNHLAGTIQSITGGMVTAEVVVDVAGNELVSVITTSSVERMHLTVGDPITVVIKATAVMLAKDD